MRAGLWRQFKALTDRKMPETWLTASEIGDWYRAEMAKN
jgi:hypothetical protein